MHLNTSHSSISSFPRSTLCRHLGGEGRSFSRSFEADRASTCPRHHAPLGISDADNRVVKRRVNTDNALGHCFSDFFLSVARYALRLSPCMLSSRIVVDYFGFGACFFPATVRRGPLHVRELVRVRCPRTGKFFRWRSPRYDPIST